MAHEGRSVAARGLLLILSLYAILLPQFAVAEATLTPLPVLGNTLIGLGSTRTIGGLPSTVIPCSVAPNQNLMVEHAPTFDELARSLLPYDPVSAAAAVPGNEKRLVVESGDTFVALLGRAGVSPAEAIRWHREARPTHDLAKLKIGQTLTLHFDTAGRQLEQLMFELDKLSGILVEQRATESGRGRIVARRIDLPSRNEVRGTAGTIETTMAAEAHLAGVPRKIVAEVAAAFGGKVEFARLRRGDNFRILWEMRTSLDGSYAESGRLIAAEIENQGKTFAAIRHEDEQGRVGYFDLEGRPLGGSGFAQPIERARLTSRFSYSRYHPVLRRSRPHYGVDLAAPTGTPVRAIAAGVVKSARWDGGLGRAIRIDHGGGERFASVYGHLSGFARDLHQGARVTKGQIIGFVGSTGLSTGPHLHLAIVKGGRFVDPLETMKTRIALDPVLDDESFDKRRDELSALLDGLDPESPVQIVSRTGT